MAQPQVQQTLRTQGFTTDPMSPREVQGVTSRQRPARWKPVIEAAGLVAQ